MTNTIKSPLTMAEKILSVKTGKILKAGEVVIVDVDGVMATDTTGPYAIKAFEEMGGTQVWDSEKCALIIDHAAPDPYVPLSHKLFRAFRPGTNRLNLCRYWAVAVPLLIAISEWCSRAPRRSEYPAAP